MDKTLKKKLDWYLRFAYQDLGDIDDIDAWRLLVQAEMTKEFGVMDDEIPFKTVLAYANAMKKSPEGMDVKSRLRKDQAEFKTEFESFMEKSIMAPKESNTDLKARIPLYPAKTVTLEISSFMKNGEIRVSQKTPPPKNVLNVLEPYHDPRLFLSFLQTVSNIPIDVFYICRECSNWYVHITKREREFCSSKCASRHIMGRKRGRKSKRIKGGLS